jgi:hypothetical protein
MRNNLAKYVYLLLVISYNISSASGLAVSGGYFLSAKITEYKRTYIVGGGTGWGDKFDIPGYGSSYVNFGVDLCFRLGNRIFLEGGFEYLNGFRKVEYRQFNNGIFGDDPYTPSENKYYSIISQCIYNYGLGYNRIPDKRLSPFIQGGLMFATTKITEPGVGDYSKGSNVGLYLGTGVNIQIAEVIYLTIPLKIRIFDGGVYYQYDEEDRKSDNGFRALPPYSLSIGIGVGYVLL